MKYLIALMVLLPLYAFADVNVTWTPPTTRVDDSPLPPEEIAGYRLQYSVNGAAQPELFVTGAAHVLPIATGRVCVTMATRDTDGHESVFTDEVCRKANPNRPTNLRVR